MIVLTALPVVACMVLFNHTVNAYLLNTHRQDGQTLGQIVAGSLSDRLDHFARHPGELLDSLGRDPRVAFVCVSDPRGKLLHAGVFDAGAWQKFQGVRPAKPGGDGVAVTETLSSGLIGEVVVQTVPILDAPTHWDEQGKPVGERAVQGYLVLALRNTGLQTAIISFQAAQAIVTIVVCATVLLIVVWMIRRWTRPWTDLVHATRRLARGEAIEPVAVRGEDEVGFLCAAFNDMAGRIVRKRVELEELNSELEQKVRQRTLELQVKTEQLEAAAYADALTGLANRRAFADAIKANFAESRAYGCDLCVLLIDLDGFKEVNDTYGHDKGDELLKLAADALRRHARPGHVPARMGGDEFLMLMPHTALEDAATIADAIRNDFTDAARALLGADFTTSVSMSQGLASVGTARPTDTVEFLAIADRALYKAKQAGKSCLVVHEPPVADAPDDATQPLAA